MLGWLGAWGIFENSQNYFANFQDITSKTLQIEINEVLEDLELNLEIEKDKQMFFLIKNIHDNTKLLLE